MVSCICEFDKVPDRLPEPADLLVPEPPDSAVTREDSRLGGVEGPETEETAEAKPPAPPDPSLLVRCRLYGGLDPEAWSKFLT